MSFELSLTSILLMANALLLGIASLVIIRFRREARALLRFWQSPMGSALAAGGADDTPDGDARDKRLFAQSVLRLEHQLLLLRRDVMRNAVRDGGAQGMASDAPSRSALPLDHAVRMARMGASVDDLTRTCGLSLGEARLMQKLHGKTPTRH